VDANGVCQCRDGKNCRNPGKHFATRYGWQSVIASVDDVEQHLDDGGSVGLSLWYFNALQNRQVSALQK